MCPVQLVSPLSLLQLWDTVQGQLAFQYTHPKSLNCITFHPEGQVVATGNWSGSVTFFQADGLKVTKVGRRSHQENTRDNSVKVENDSCMSF